MISGSMRGSASPANEARDAAPRSNTVVAYIYPQIRALLLLGATTKRHAWAWSPFKSAAFVRNALVGSAEFRHGFGGAGMNLTDVGQGRNNRCELPAELRPRACWRWRSPRPRSPTTS